MLRAHVQKLIAQSAPAEELLAQANLPKANWSWPRRARLMSRTVITSIA